jgi:hemerythrin-like metal-binding protein
MGKPGVLIVEDDRSAALAMEAILLDEGYQPSRAADGFEALAMLSRPDPPSLILLDLEMPGMDGVEFRRRQLADSRLAAIPVVLVSGDASLARLGRELGVAAAVEKPIQVAKLLCVVGECLRAPWRPGLDEAMNEWDFYPQVGFPSIDSDHREIAVALRRLIDAVQDDDQLSAAALAGAMVARTVTHFALEERLMDEIEFTFSPRHRRAHDAFVARAQERLAELNAQGLTLACLQWTTETMEWFRSHVLTEDMALARALIGSRASR